jgi:hypothetical protein
MALGTSWVVGALGVGTTVTFGGLSKSFSMTKASEVTISTIAISAGVQAVNMKARKIEQYLMSSFG